MTTEQQDLIDRPEEEISETLTRYSNATGHWVVYCAIERSGRRTSVSNGYILVCW